MCRDNRRVQCDLEVLLSEKPTESNVRSHLHNRRPYRDPNAQPVKWMRLIQWWLVHRVPLDMIITPSVEATACMRFKIPDWKWQEAKKRFPGRSSARFEPETNLASVGTRGSRAASNSANMRSGNFEKLSMVGNLQV
jgi:hypothetical protein